MKIKRLILASGLTLALTACSGEKSINIIPLATYPSTTATEATTTSAPEPLTVEVSLRTEENIVEEVTSEQPTAIETTTVEITATATADPTTIEQTTPEPTTENPNAEFGFTPNTKAMVEQMILDRVPNYAAFDIPAYISWLSGVNPSQAQAWEKIMYYWTGINDPAFTNLTNMPAGLPQDNSLCIIVLGLQLEWDGSMKPELIGRLQTALAAAQQYPNAYVLVSGKGVLAISEAEVMADWLVGSGIDPARIIIENRSINTAENAIFSYRILRDSYPQVDSVAIVTSDFHVPVSCLLFQEMCWVSQACGDKELRVVSNAGYISHSEEYFSIKGQGNWMNRLYKEL